MTWGRPDWLNGLWLMIPLLWGLFFLLRRREKRLARLADPAVLPRLVTRRDPRRRRTRLLLWSAAVAFAVVALARPQWGFHWEEVRRRGLDLMVVLDTSNSMLAEDIKPNRLQQAKWGVRDLLRQLKGDRVGLVAFAGSSFLQCPLTIDYAAFAMTLDDLYAGIIPRGGTAIEQALQTALRSFEKDTGADRAIILITDGEDHEGDPLRLENELKRLQVRVYAIGVGTLEGELIPQAEAEAAGGGFLKDRAGQVVKSRLEEDKLQQLALSTGGAYVRSAPGDFGLERVFQESIAHLKRSEQESRMARIHEDRFPWFLAAALACLALEAVLGERVHARRENGA